MGFSWRRALRAVGTGGLSEGFRAAGVDLNPGPNGNDQRAPGYENRSPDQFQWDPNTGMPIGINGIPGSEFGLQYQYRAQQEIRQRQNALWGDAQGALGQGADLLQSYRPGGSAALASGIFGQRANLFAAQAQSLTEPDLLAAYREKKDIEASREAKRARNIQTILGIAGLGANVAGMAAGVPGAGAAAAATSAQGNAFAQNGGPPMGSAGPGGSTMLGPGYGNAGSNAFPNNQPPGSIAAPQLGPQSFQGFQAPNPLGTAQATTGRGSQAPGAASGAGGPAPGGGPQPGGPQPPGGAAGGTGMAMMGGGGGAGGDGNFSSQAFAASAARSMPHLEPVIRHEMANDLDYRRFVTTISIAADERLTAAMAG